MEFCRQTVALITDERRENFFREITGLYESVPKDYTNSLRELYKKGIADKVDEQEISTLINFNREMYTTFKSLMLSLKDYLLTPDESDHFDNQPGFIR